MRSAHLLAAAVGLFLWPLATPAADLSQVERRIAKEPTYQGKAKYALAVFGPEAEFKVWMVVDGEVLYVDKNGNGDLTELGEKFSGRKDEYRGIIFKVGDIAVGKQSYTNMEVHIGKLKDYVGTDDEASQKLLAADPEALGYRVFVDVPLRRPLKDEKGKPVTSLRHFVAVTDANGVLQFSARPADAPIFHFGGAWAICPRDGQKFVLGRPEEFTAWIGTPGLGAGTLAIILYHTQGDEPAMFVPKEARPVLEAQFPGKEGKPIPVRFVLEDRC